MNFRLTFAIPPLPQKISYTHKILLAGSCFAENIGTQLRTHKLNAVTNPNGIVYNPISIANQLDKLLTNEGYNEEELFYYNELWSSWQHHGQFSNTNKAIALAAIANGFLQAQTFIEQGDWLIITFGSAYVYTLNSTGQVVANCHKYPNTAFTKQLLTTEEICSAWQILIAKLKLQNPKLKIVFTVSPVRYMRDGLINNTISKAILLQAAHFLCNSFEEVWYFPAYELVIDDLRDYRFFAEDLVHPNTQAIQYVWQHFVEAAFDSEAKNLLPQIAQLITEVKHKPFHTNTQAYKKFVSNHAAKLQQLTTNYPSIDWEGLDIGY